MKKPRIGAIILAAGESRRMGIPKPLLIYREENFLNTIIKTASRNHLSPILVVTGSKAEEVEASIKTIGDVSVIRNFNWMEGQGSSISTGIQSVPENVDAVIIMLVDQPGVPGELLTLLENTYQTSKKPIVITRAGVLLTPPTLLDRVCFNDLSMLKGDEGARKLLKDFDYQECPWEDEKSLADFDTPDDYHSLTNI